MEYCADFGIIDAFENLQSASSVTCLEDIVQRVGVAVELRVDASCVFYEGRQLGYHAGHCGEVVVEVSHGCYGHFFGSVGAGAQLQFAASDIRHVYRRAAWLCRDRLFAMALQPQGHGLDVLAGA